MIIELNDAQLLISGKPTFLRSASIHYWRVQPDQWDDRLLKAKEAGMNCIETYVPWFWHEFEENSFDFSGETAPERNLRGFLDAVNSWGLYAIVRPGPFINSELRYGGYPPWIFHNYPEIHSHRLEGVHAFWLGMGIPLPSPLHPVYVQLVRRWYQRVTPVLQEHSLERGGCIVLFQPDNEVNLGFTYDVAGSLYDDHIIGSEQGLGGIWHAWLEQRFGGSIQSLNSRYNSAYGAFSEVMPPERLESSVPGTLRVLDWLHFKRCHIVDYVRLLVAEARANGLTLPCILNEPMNHSWMWHSGEHAWFSHEMQKAQDKCMTVGHTYLHGGEMDIHGLSAIISRIEMIKTSELPGPILSVETGAGWYEYGEKIRADHNWDLLMRAQIGHGLNGYNVFLFCDGYNPADSDISGEHKFFNSPVTKDGSVRASWHILKGLNEFIEGWESELLQTRKSYDLEIGLFSELPLIANPVRYYTDATEKAASLFPVGGDYLEREQISKSVLCSLEHLAKILVGLDVKFEYLSLNNPPRTRKKTVIVPNPGMLPDEAFGYLSEHLRSGGNVVFYPLIPRLNTDFVENLTLAEMLPLLPASVVPEPGWTCGDTVFRWVDGRRCDGIPTDSPIYTYRLKDDASGEVLASYKGQICAYRQPVLGGNVIVCGIVPKYSSPMSQEFYEHLFVDVPAVERSIMSLDKELSTVVRISELDGTDGPLLITVINHGKVSYGTQIKVMINGRGLVFPLASKIVIPQKKALFLWSNIDLGFTTIRYCTSEIVPTSDERTEFAVRGPAVDTPGEIGLTRRCKVTLDGENLRLEERDGLFVGTYYHTSEPRRMVIAQHC